MKTSILVGLIFYSSFLYCQESYVSIDQQKYRIKVLGEGDLTIIFENGMSDSLEVWGAIPDSVAKFARVFLYDRADIGKSDTSHNERTIPNMVFELRSILENQNIHPPYILVGHSFGSLIVRYFTSNYPDEVKGLLLLDPVPESFWEHMTKKEYNDYVKGGNEWYETRFPARYRKEWYSFMSNMDYMSTISIDPELPVILVSATSWHWYKYQKDILHGLKNAQHIELEGEHHIFQNYPDQTVKYIKELSSNSGTLN